MFAGIQELDLLRTAVDAASILIVAVDGEGRIRGINPAVTRLTGMSEDVACMRRIWELPALEPERAQLETIFARRPVVPASLQFHLPNTEGLPQAIKWKLRLERTENEASPIAVLVGVERCVEAPALKQSEARTRRLVESNIIGVAFWDERGVTEANQAFLELVGFTREELQAGAISWQCMTPAEYHAMDERATSELRANGTCTPYEKEFVAKDGSRVPVLVGGAKFDDSDSDVLTGVAFIADLREHTDLRKVRDQLLIDEQRARIETEVANARLLLLLEGSKRLSRTVRLEETLETLAEVVVPGLADWGCVVHPGEDGCPAVVASAHGDPNKRSVLRRLHECRLDMAAPEGPARVFRTGETAWYEDVMAERLFANPPSWPLVGNLDPKALQCLRELGMKSVLCVPVLGRGKVDAVLMLVSETDPHRYDKQDAALARDLAGRAAISLENARLLSEALDSVRARDDFLSVAAHELRTPLTSLLLQLQILARALVRQHLDSTPAWRSSVSAETQARRLATLVDRLLDVARLANNRMTLRVDAVDLRFMLSELVTTLAPALEKAGCAIEISAPDRVVGRWDRIRIEQVLMNLLSNAIKFGAGRLIEVAIATTSTNVRISVRDQGIGISAEDQERIFDRFERAVSSRHFGGLGLGLYISVQILRAHHGSLRVESTPGRGTCFIIDLPPDSEPLPFKPESSVEPTAYHAQ